MRSLAFSITISCLFTFSSFAEDYTCVNHTDWPNDRSFTAVISVKTNSVVVTGLSLSENWPLTKQCDSPLVKSPIEFNRNLLVSEISFGPYSDNECTYVFVLNSEETDLALLHPIRSDKIWGEKPFLARCTAI